MVEQLSELCYGGMLLVITNVTAGDFHIDVVSHLLQLLEVVMEEGGEDIGRVLCLLPGWEKGNTEITGPSLDDACGEKVKIRVCPASDFATVVLGIEEHPITDSVTEEEFNTMAAGGVP